MVLKRRLIGELAVVGVLAAATTVALSRDEAPYAAPLAQMPAVAAAASPTASDAGPAALRWPAVPAEGSSASASSGRPVRRSVWRTALYRSPARDVADIPMRALEAYQRAATVIDVADPACHLDWFLLAAIAKVESDHGRYGGSSIDSDGHVHPLILGPRLTGVAHTSRIADTDAGRLDGDLQFDRAVGPFQIVPATWSQVRVDADGDGLRDPQDVDDAALGAAVYLCSGRGDLGTRSGQRRAVHRYNRDGGYVDLVMAVDADYEQAASHQVSALVLLARDYGGASAPWSPTLPPQPGPGHDASFDPVGSQAWTDSSPTSSPVDPVPASPSAQPVTSPTPSLAPAPSSAPSATPSPAPSATPSATPSAAPSATPSATPTPIEPSPTEPSPSEPSPREPSPIESDSALAPSSPPGTGAEAGLPVEGGSSGALVVAGLPWALPAGTPLLWFVLRRRRQVDAE